jgi:D-lactate dehydrogenase
MVRDKMNISLFSAHQYDNIYFERAKCSSSLDATFTYHQQLLSKETAILAKNADAVCVFVNDTVDKGVLGQLDSYGVRAVFLRCAGYNNVDLEAAAHLGVFVANVPSYSPESVAEFAVALIQSLNRKTCVAHERVRIGNFSLNGLAGFALHGKTVGIIGTGKIGICFARIMAGFGCRLLAFDPVPNEEFLRYGKVVELETLLEESDIISLHCPLVQSTKHIINRESLSQMKPGAVLVNVSRGELIDSGAVIESLKQKHLGALAIDVYERERPLFYSDHSSDIIDDDVLMRLFTFPNVIVTGHQAFLTEEALTEIAKVTMENMTCFGQKMKCKNDLTRGDIMALQARRNSRI